MYYHFIAKSRDYIGAKTFFRSIFIMLGKGENFFMRIAMGLSFNEKDPNEAAKRFYKKMSNLEYVAGGSTNLAAGKINPALSNCYLLEIHDDMQHIAKSVSDVMLLSKGSGGIGASVTKLRASGSPLKSTGGGASTGPTPFAKIIDTAIRAIQRGGKKKGALCFYMENCSRNFLINWHSHYKNVQSVCYTISI
jgi:ribonucleoside-diphosphate reductase alpha chain